MEKQDFNLNNSDWKGIFLIAGLSCLLMAAMYLIAGIFAGPPNAKGMIPTNISEWFIFFQKDQLTGLFLLGIADVGITLLSLPLFLALYIIFKEGNKTLPTIALIIGFLGAFLYITINPAFSMLKFSQQFTNTILETERTQFLAAGQSILIKLHSTAAIFGLNSVWMSSLLFSVLLLRRNIFNRLIPYLGIGGFSFLIISGFFTTYTTTGPSNIVSSIIITITYAGGGFSTLIWYILLGLQLFKLENNRNKISHS